MPVLYWLTLSAYIGAASIGFLNCDVYRRWLEKSEAEQATIIEAAVEETDEGGTPEFVIIGEEDTGNG